MGEWDFGDFGYDPNTDYFAPNYFAPLNEDYGGSYFTPQTTVPNLTDYFSPGEVDYQDYYAPTASAPAPAAWQGYNPDYAIRPDISNVGKAAPPSPTISERFRKIGDTMIQKATDNPFEALLALGGLGTIGAGLYSSAGSSKIQAPKRTLELTPQEQALATRATASLPNDPNRIRQYAQIRQAALERVRRDLGPGGEYSTPGQEYLKRIEEQIMADQTNRQVQDIGIAQGGLRDLSQLANQQWDLNTRIELQNAALAQQRGAGLTQLGGTLLGAAASPFLYYNRQPAMAR